MVAVELQSQRVTVCLAAVLLLLQQPPRLEAAAAGATLSALPLFPAAVRCRAVALLLLLPLYAPSVATKRSSVASAHPPRSLTAPPSRDLDVGIEYSNTRENTDAAPGQFRIYPILSFCCMSCHRGAWGLGVVLWGRLFASTVHTDVNPLQALSSAWGPGSERASEQRWCCCCC